MADKNAYGVDTSTGGVQWSQGWGFDYYSPSGDINQALATRDTSGNVTITDYAKQNLSTTQLVSLMQTLGLAGPVQTPTPETPPEDKPHLSELGQAIQDSLAEIARGGDRSQIVADIQGKATAAAKAGKTDIAQQLTAIASEYANAGDYANQSDRGLGYLMGLQRDLAGGKYTIGGDSKGTGGTVALPTGYTAPTGQYQGWGFTYDSPTGDINDATNLYVSPPPPPPDTWYQGWGFEYQSATGDINDTITGIRWTASDDIVKQNWPTLYALKQTLMSLDGATVTVNTVPVADTSADFLNGRQ